ncbi:MAG: nitroreductase family protein [Lachnospiraceae bacterium]|nr:nitroreductase family protein [Lachnospiraceae bacterium]
MKETLQDLKERRACRAYTAEQVREEDLAAILEAGTYAATARGSQEPLIVAVQDPETYRKIEKLNALAMGMEDGHPFYGAPMVLVVFANGKMPFAQADGNLVLGNLMNAAQAVGVDSCYIWRAYESFETEEGKALKAAWGVPEDYVGIGNLILGYGKPEGKKPTADRKEGYVIRV